MKSQYLVFLGAGVMIMGMLIIFAGLLKSSIADQETSHAKVKGGAIIMIGPLPIIIGSDKESVATLILLAAALILLSYILFVRR